MARAKFQIMKNALEIMTGPLAEEIGKYQAEKEVIYLRIYLCPIILEKKHGNKKTSVW